MTTSLKRIGRLASVAAALTLLGGGVAGARIGTPLPVKPDFPAKAVMERHFQHEDRIFGAQSTNSVARTPAEAMALHFKHEDAILGQRSRLSQQAPTSSGNDFDAVLLGAGAALVLLLGGTAVVITTRHSRTGRRVLES
jgi:hypothetical protein